MKHTRTTAEDGYPEGTQAVRRAVGLLKALGTTTESGLSDLARRCELHRTTAYRLLAALEREGLVERAADGEAYRLGPELVALARHARGGGDVRTAARPELERLASESRETVTLEVLVGAEVLILDEATGPHVVGSRPEIGTRWPAHATSTGKVLLAQLDEDDRDGRLPASLTAWTPRTLTDREALDRELGRVRDRGHAASVEELEPGYAAVGAPVFGEDGRAVAALSVGGPKNRLTPARRAELTTLVTAAAAAASARLGFRPAGATADSIRPSVSSRSRKDS